MKNSSKLNLYNEADPLFGPELKALQFGYQKPFTLMLENDELLIATQIVRIIPGKRIVVFGKWKDRDVVAKIFFSRKHSNQELQGMQLLKKNKIPAPSLLFHGTHKDAQRPTLRARMRGIQDKVFVIIMKRIMDAENLQSAWQTRDSFEQMKPLLQAVLIELATQHVLGIKQKDLHLNNFLLSNRIIYTLDAASIQAYPHLIAKQDSMENIALFVSQLGLLEKDQQIALFRYYAKSRGWLLHQNDIPEFLLLVKKFCEARWQQYQQKIMRESTRFAVLKRLTVAGMYDRRYASDKLQRFLRQPELFFQQQNIQVLKAGRSSTVIKTRIDQRTLVIKRYNIKNVWHGLRRMLRPTRAYQAWRLAHKLKLFEVATASPVAFIEKKFLGLRFKSYYITEYVSGMQAGEYFARQKEEEVARVIVKRMTQLLKQLFKLEITHGDLKITNFIIDEHEKPVIIDFDGAKEHASMHALHKAWRKEMQRFLFNFKDSPHLTAQCIAEIR